MPISIETISSLLENNPEIAQKSPYKNFQIFIDDENINFIITKTKRFALGFSLAERELPMFFGNAVICPISFSASTKYVLDDCNILFINKSMT